VRTALRVDGTDPVVITVTRLAPEKKIERAIEAMPALLARIPGAVLAIVGDGPERPRLLERARALGVSEQVRFVGAVIQEDLPDWYRGADLLLSLLDRTNASNPVFEAMACGKPVIALDTGSTSEVVRDGETGRLVTYAELPRLGEIVAEMLGNHEARTRLGRNAQRFVRELLLSPAERLGYEVELLERAARGEPLPPVPQPATANAAPGGAGSVR
jgi:glycosyltransferase involved in cell wall biosynthesis